MNRVKFANSYEVFKVHLVATIILDIYMRNLILFFLFIVNVYGLFGQEKCGIILDKNSKTPVPYATIYYSRSAIGSFSTEYGNYCISKSNQKIDSVYISALGYLKYSIDYIAFLKADTIYIQNMPIELNDVIVKGKRSKIHTKEIGYHKTSLIEFKENGYNPNSNQRIATFIAHNSEKWAIKSIHCRVIPKENKQIQFFRIRLRIYKNDSLQMLPKEDLLNENITIDIAPKEKNIEFDLVKYNLKAPNNGFWISMESIGYIDKDGEYIAIRDHEYGKYTLKDTKKIKLKSIERITPMYRYILTSPKKSAISSWNNKWKHENYKEKLNFCFGATIEKLQ